MAGPLALSFFVWTYWTTRPPLIRLPVTAYPSDSTRL